MSGLQHFKKEKVAGEVAKINELSASDDLKKNMKQKLFREIVSGKSALISADEYTQLREAYVTDKRLTFTEQKKINLAYTKAQEAGFNGTQEEFKNLLFGTKKSEADLEGFPIQFPPAIKMRIEKEYKNNPEGRKEAIRKSNAIKTLSVSKEGNTIEVGGKTFFILRPKPNKKDVFAGPKGYENVRYITGNALERELKNANKKLFASEAEAVQFIDIYMPGKSRTTRVQNFADLMGLEKSGFRYPDGGWDGQGKRGYAWLAKPGGDRAWSFEFSDAQAIINWSYLDYSFPVVCFQD